MGKKKAIVIGAGIVGLATARALAATGFSVTVLERTEKAIGASIRNFGMIWPIGQPTGALYARAIRSRDIWKEIGESKAFWYAQPGSLHLAYHPDEMTVLEEVFNGLKEERVLRLLSPEEIKAISPVTVSHNLLGGLFSADELIVDPRQAIGALPAYLTENFDISFRWDATAVSIKQGSVQTSMGSVYHGDLIVICSGADFETLYPGEYSKFALTKCKLQMMRMRAQPGNMRIGPALCGGLSLIHYKSFASAPSLAMLKQRYEKDYPEYLRWGIHVMVAQNGQGELTIGDSHEYGMTHDPFDRELINRLILDYLSRLAEFPESTIAESWNGIYAKSTEGKTELIHSPEPGVYLLNALGGAGMTLSFGLAEEFAQTL